MKHAIHIHTQKIYKAASLKQVTNENIAQHSIPCLFSGHQFKASILNHFINIW